MPTVSATLVTVVAEKLLERDLIAEFQKLGAQGYTTTEAHGKGTRGVRASTWEGANVRIELVVTPEVGERIVNHVAERYFAHHGVVVWTQEVQVVRIGKYRSGESG
jgi:nitrogen regulatory protein PII